MVILLIFGSLTKDTSKSHLKVVKKLMTMAANGIEVIYITGSHDELLRKFSKTTIGNISIVDKYITELNGKKAWFFHGDIFDVSIQNAKWVAKLGGEATTINID